MSALLAAPASATHIGEEALIDQQTVASSDQLLGALRGYERAAAPQREAALQRLVAAASARRQRMTQLLERNPALAALRALPAAVRARLPAAAQAQVEREVALTGQVMATVGDDFARGLSTQLFEIEDASSGQRFTLSVGDASQRDLLAMAGRRARVSALVFDRHLLVASKRQIQWLAADGTSTGAATTLATTSTPVLGNQTTLVIMANFTDTPLSCTQADLQSRLFGSGNASVNESYRQSSAGAVTFSGQVVGPFNINYSSAGTCDPNGWAAAAKSAATAAGFDVSKYMRVSYALPRNPSCGWSGLASLGGTPPTNSWVLSCASTGVFAHELGHNLRFHHASTPTSEYGDSTDPMGGALLVQSNAANRVMAGWVGSGQVTDVAVGGSYAIDALGNSSSTVPRVLRLPKVDSGDTYYISMRQPIGLDAGLPSAFFGAVGVHYATGSLPAQTFRVANLTAGQSWTDSVNGVTVTHQGLTSTGANVGVSMGGSACSRSAPSVSVAPASQVAAPGATLAYTVSVTNNNSAACGGATFNLAQSLPAGFAGSFDAGSLAVAPSATVSSRWSVVSAASSADATYTLTATAAEASVANNAAAHASYTVLAPVTPPPPPPPPTDTTAPSLVITSPAPGGSFSGRSMGLSANASDASGVAQVQFFVDDKLLATDTTAPFTASWNLRKVAAGTHTLRVRAVDTLGNAAEQSVSFTVVK